MATPTEIASYLLLFILVGLLFVFVNLLLGKFLRPSSPNREKLEIYECGEPAIGSGFVQFDLRFYVVALVFIVFDVEVAFLYPLATVYGKATHLRAAAAVATTDVDSAVESDIAALYGEMGLVDPAAAFVDPAAAVDSLTPEAVAQNARQLAWAAFGAINLFFGVLLLGFAYEWRGGAFDWVRAVGGMRQRPPPAAAGGSAHVNEVPTLTP
jgi:NADH-quinone oxidoreductase subunit A